MIRIKVELVPFGDETKVEQIGEMVLANDSTDGVSYEAWTAPNAWSDSPSMFARLKDYDRSQSVWELIRLLLEAMVLEKHVPDGEEDSLSQRLKRRLTYGG